MIYDKHNETHEKYIQSLKALDAHNEVSEYVKEPETREERAFMHETNKERFSTHFSLSDIPEERYNHIFGDCA